MVDGDLSQRGKTSLVPLSSAGARDMWADRHFVDIRPSSFRDGSLQRGTHLGVNPLQPKHPSVASYAHHRRLGRKGSGPEGYGLPHIECERTAGGIEVDREQPGILAAHTPERQGLTLDAGLFWIARHQA